MDLLRHLKNHTNLNEVLALTLDTKNNDNIRRERIIFKPLLTFATLQYILQEAHP